MAQDARRCIPQTIAPNPNRSQQRAQSDPVSYSQQGGLNESPLEPRMLMPYLPKLAAKGQQIAGWLDMTDDWEEIKLTNGDPRDHLQELIHRWLDNDEKPEAPHTLSFFVGVVRNCGKGKLANEMESKIRALVLGGQGPMPQPQHSEPVGGPQQGHYNPGYSQYPPYNSQWGSTSSPQVQNLPQSSPNLPQSSPNLPHSSPNLPQSSPNLPHSSQFGQGFTPSGTYQPAPRMEFHEGMDFPTSESQPSLLTPVEESSTPYYRSEMRGGPQSGVKPNQVSSGPTSPPQQPGSFGMTNVQETREQLMGNPTLPYQRQPINPETSQLGHITQHNEIQRDYSSTSFGQQQLSSFGMTNVQETREQLMETFLRLRRLLHRGELEADYDQNDGQRCVSAQEVAEIYKSVFRISVDNPESGRWHGSGCFVKKKGSYCILTACHNLLDKSDGDKVKEGKWEIIKGLEEKMKGNLLFTSFILPDEQLKLTHKRPSSEVVVGDISHMRLIYDPENDILTIPCKDPKGFGGTSIQLKVDAMQQYNPQLGHLLHIVHNPWKIAKREDVDKVLPNEHVKHNIGMICRIEGKAIMYDMVTYPGSSGAPVFFAGYRGLILVGIHRKSCDGLSLNQGSHLTEEFVERMYAEAM